MSKERLEEIENKLLQATNEDDEDVVYASICAEAVLEDLQWTVGYAKEQAERVPELKNQITKMAAARYKDSEELDKTHKENKHYRELLISPIMKDLIKLEDKGNFLPSDKRERFSDFKWDIKALEESE